MYKAAHIGLAVKDAEVSRSFYQDVLGFRMVNSFENERIKLVFIDIGGHILELVQQLKPEAVIERGRGVVDHIAFQVDDVDAELRRLQSAGVKVLSVEPVAIGRSLRNFFCLGPDGERLEFMEGSLF